VGPPARLRHAQGAWPGRRRGGVREVVLSIPDLRTRRVPDLGVKSGERSTGWTVVEVFDLPRWVFLVLPLGPLSSLLMRVARRRGVLVELPVTRRTSRHRRSAEALAGAAVVSGALALGRGAVGGGAGLVVLGVVLLAAGALVATAGLSALWVRGRLEGDGIRLRGVHRAFADGVTFVRAVGRPAPGGPTTLVGTGLPPV
jgi:hypothetical protein